MGKIKGNNYRYFQQSVLRKCFNSETAYAHNNLKLSKLYLLHLPTFGTQMISLSTYFYCIIRNILHKNGYFATTYPKKMDTISIF